MTTPDAYHDDERANAEALERAHERLLAHREGTLHFDDHFVPTPFITDPETGRLIIPVPEAAFFAHEHIFFVPEESEDALQLLLSLERAGESLLTDRWQAHHGEPEQVRWAECYVDAAKRGPWVFDGDSLMRPNPLGGDEPWVLRSINEDRAALASTVVKLIGKDVTEALAVGVDDLGVHVRVRFGVVRLAFPERVPDGNGAVEAYRSLVEGAGS